MQGVTPTVFVSSRFDEFRELRRLLRERLGQNRLIPCRVVDHSENYPDTHPPLARSLDAARASDVFVLLVGESYGTIPPGHDRSYTELEYEAASARPGNAIVLAYFSGDPDTEPCDGRVAAFRKRIRANHVHAQLADDLGTAALDITQEVLLHLLPFAPPGAPDDDTVPWLEGDGGDDDVVTAALAAARDRRIDDHPALRLGDDGVDGLKDIQVLARPSLTAAMEQRNEAVRAIGIGERRWAIWHLQHALRHRPLDLPALYWCAHLRLASLRREDAHRALPLALRAARIAEKDLSPSAGEIAVAACYMLAARAAGSLENAAEGVEFATRAQDAAGYYWRTHVEAARQHALAGDVDASMKQLERAFYLRPGVLEAFRGDPAFRRCQKEYAALRRTIRARTRGEVVDILSAEELLWHGLEELLKLVPREHATLPAAWLAAGREHAAAERSNTGTAAALQLVKAANRSFFRQHEALRKLGEQAGALAASEPVLAERLTQAARDFELVRARTDAEMQTISGEVDHTVLDPASTAASPGGAAAIALFVVGLVLAGGGRPAIGVTAMLVSAAVFFVSGSMMQTRRHERSRHERLEAQRARLAEAKMQMEHDEAIVERTRQQIDYALRTALDLFVTSSHTFERRALRRRIYCPTPSVEHASAGALVRLSPADDAAQFTFDERLLPDALGRWMPAALPLPLPHQLYRVKPGSPLRVVSREAVYFT